MSGKLFQNTFYRLINLAKTATARTMKRPGTQPENYNVYSTNVYTRRQPNGDIFTEVSNQPLGLVMLLSEGRIKYTLTREGYKVFNQGQKAFLSSLGFKSSANDREFVAYA